MSTPEQKNKDVASNEADVAPRFNGAELSQSVLARDWSSPEEDTAWSNL
jgi:hypothetical protein